MGNHAKKEHSSDMQEFQLLWYMPYRKNGNMDGGFTYLFCTLSSQPNEDEK